MRLDAVKVASDRQPSALDGARCEVISLRIATASLAVASCFTWLWLAPKLLRFRSGAILLRLVRSTRILVVVTCSSFICCLQIYQGERLSFRRVSNLENGWPGASICSRLYNTGAAVIHAYSASLSISTIFVKSGSMRGVTTDRCGLLRQYLNKPGFWINDDQALSVPFQYH